MRFLDKTMEPLITKGLMELGSQSASKSVVSFFELIALKFFGKSIAKLKAEAQVEEDKVLSKWEEVEKPLWLQAEAIKMKRQYENFGNTIKEASKYITSEESSISNDNDLFWGLLEHSKEITNKDVQGLIAKIIAGEYNAPGTYSMSTLQILKSLGKKDLEKLSLFASFYLSDHGFLRDFFHIREETTALRTRVGIDYADFLELQNLGLIQSGGYVISISLKKDSVFKIKYGNEYLAFKATKDFERWSFPECYAFTGAGKEIVQHLEVKKSDIFKEYLRGLFKEKGFEPQN